jgi:hypothetical protein
LEYQIRFLGGKLEHEIGRKASRVSLNGLVQVARRHRVQLGQVPVEQHLLSAEQQDAPLDSFGRNDGPASRHFLGHHRTCREVIEREEDKF